MTSSTDDAPAHLMSRHEECCLKTALAFVVLRKRLENDDDYAKNGVPSPPLLRNLMKRSIIPTMPSSSSLSSLSHAEKMMKIAISTATKMCQASNQVMPLDDTYKAAYATLDGICIHLALQIRDNQITDDWIQRSLSGSKEEPLLAVFTVWHRILLANATMVGSKLVFAIGRVLQHMYNEVHSNSLRMVNLLELLEASISMRLEETSPQTLLDELSHAMGAELVLPIRKSDLAYFVLEEHRNGCHAPGNKILLRFCLYDMMEKLSACL